jgi:hypothetical protein
LLHLLVQYIRSCQKESKTGSTEHRLWDRTDSGLEDLVAMIRHPLLDGSDKSELSRDDLLPISRQQ